MNFAVRLLSMMNIRRAMVFSTLALLSTFLTLNLSAQNTINTVAGGGSVAGPATGTNADIPGPSSVIRDAQGNTYIAVPTAQEIFKVDTNGNLSVFAGIGYPTEEAWKLDGGPASSGSLNQPNGLAADTLGNIYIADTTNYLIRQVNSSGIINSIAGNTHQCPNPTATTGACGDGAKATSATMSSPYAVATDAAGNVYLADTVDNRIRVVNMQKKAIIIAGVTINAGNIATIAGTGYPCTTPTQACGDGGSALVATVNNPQGIAVDTSGNVYIADTLDHRVRIISTAGIISAYAGTGTTCNLGGSNTCGDGGLATAATISSPWQLSVDAAGDLFITDPPESRIREVNGSSKLMSSVAGSGKRSFGGDNGAATSAYLNSPRGVFIDASGNLLIGDTGNQRVRIVNAQQTISTLAGGGLGGDGGSAIASDAIISADRDVALDSFGNLYIADTAGNRIREVSGGNITTIVGTGIAGYTGDKGLAVNATLSGPDGLAVDGSGNVYIADTNNLVIRLFNPSTGNITTIAGTGKTCSPTTACGDGGPATSATFSFPTTVSVDNLGNYYITDQGANRIRMVNGTNGTITTVAGTGARCSTIACSNTVTASCGDGGAATSALLNEPFSAVPDNNGNLFIADTCDNRIREVNLSSGIISAYAFTGVYNFGPDKVPALQSTYDTPQNLAIDPYGNLYVSGSTFFYVPQRIDAASVGNLVSSVAGRPGDPKFYGFLGDGGAAIGSELNNYGIAVDGSGHVYIADGGTNRVREVSETSVANIAPVTLTFPATNVGTTSASMSFKITNSGLDDLRIGLVTITGDFAFVNPTPCTANQVAPGGISCTYQVTFTPTADGKRTGLVTINDNAYGDPVQKVYLGGTGQN